MGGRSPFVFLGAYLCRCLNGCTYSWDCVGSFVMSSYHSVSLKASCQPVGSQWILCTKINSSLYALEVQHPHILPYPGYPESPFPAKLIILYPIGISRALIGGKLLPILCCKVILPYFLRFFFCKIAPLPPPGIFIPSHNYLSATLLSSGTSDTYGQHVWLHMVLQASQ